MGTIPEPVDRRETVSPGHEQCRDIKHKVSEAAFTVQEIIERQKTARAAARYLNSRMHRHLDAQKREQERIQSLWAEDDGKFRIISNGKGLETI